LVVAVGVPVLLLLLFVGVFGALKTSLGARLARLLHRLRRARDHRG